MLLFLEISSKSKSELALYKAISITCCCLPIYVFTLVLKHCFFLFQSAALIAVTNVSSHLDDTAIRRLVLPKMKNVFECNSNDSRILCHILNCIEKVLDRLDKQQITDEVLPLIWNFKMYDSEMILRVIGMLILSSLKMINFFFFDYAPKMQI